MKISMKQKQTHGHKKQTHDYQRREKSDKQGPTIYLAHVF